MNKMNIEHIKNSNSGTINLLEEGEIIGELTYFSPENEKHVIFLNHTWVNPDKRGKGIAEKLVLEAIKYAIENNLKIKPTCSYVVYYFKRHPKYADLLV